MGFTKHVPSKVHSAIAVALLCLFPDAKSTRTHPQTRLFLRLFELPQQRRVLLTKGAILAFQLSQPAFLPPQPLLRSPQLADFSLKTVDAFCLTEMDGDFYSMFAGEEKEGPGDDLKSGCFFSTIGVRTAV